MHLALDGPFGDAVPYGRVEHAYAGYETVAVTRLDRMTRGALGEDVPPRRASSSVTPRWPAGRLAIAPVGDG